MSVLLDIENPPLVCNTVITKDIIKEKGGKRKGEMKKMEDSNIFIKKEKSVEKVLGM